ncbi:MAG TPA: transposase [Candidatus Dojkabacteria bacterium]|jgi:putative transposase|nr:transposase [Candidatus Dojkabacteria bacterium]
MKRRKFSVEFKTKVAVEAIRGLKTLNELSSEYEVHPNQISKWKKQLLTQAPQIFKDGRNSDHSSEEKKVERLYQEIGQLQVELNWLKKKTGFIN